MCGMRVRIALAEKGIENMSTENRTCWTKGPCFSRWTRFTRKSRFTSMMANQYVNQPILCGTLMRSGMIKLFCFPLIFIWKLKLDFGLIILTRMWVHYGRWDYLLYMAIFVLSQSFLNNYFILFSKFWVRGCGFDSFL